MGELVMPCGKNFALISLNRNLMISRKDSSQLRGGHLDEQQSNKSNLLDLKQLVAMCRDSGRIRQQVGAHPLGVAFYSCEFLKPSIHTHVGSWGKG